MKMAFNVSPYSTLTEKDDKPLVKTSQLETLINTQRYIIGHCDQNITLALR